MVDIESPSFNLNSNWLVEASAGTGKTYTIEQLFVRRLLEKTPEGTYIPIGELAAVTFTRAAARQLRSRITKRIEETIAMLETGERRPEFLERVPDESALLEAKERLRQARQGLPEASIATIHHFAATLFFEYFYEASQFSGARWASSDEERSLIREFLFFYQKDLSRVDVELLFVSCGMDFETVADEVEKELWEAQDTRSIRQLWQEFEKKKSACEPSSMEEKLLELASQFTGIATRSGQIREEVMTQIAAFCRLFDETSTFEDWQEALFDPLLPSPLFAHPKAKAMPDIQFLDMLKTEFEPLIQEAASPDRARARIAVATRYYVERQLAKRALIAPRAILYHMHKALDDSKFVAFFSSRFRAVFVDEFQDTDPIQWKIFSEIFFKHQWKGFLYLVGDPKQAIYAFRHADVYNYMRAKAFFPPSQHLALVCNFRMSRPLTEAINALFAGSKTLFWLPKLQTSIEALPLAAASRTPPLSDGKEALCFFHASACLGKKRNWPHEALERSFFSYIAQEIISLGLPLGSMAVLVRDKFQAARLEAFFQECNIPSASLRRESITSSPIYGMFLRLFRALEEPRNIRRIAALVALPPFSLSSDELLRLQTDLDRRAYYTQKLVACRQALEQRGIALAAEQALAWIGGALSESERCDFEHIVDLLIAEERRRAQFLPRDIERTLAAWSEPSAGNEEALFRRSSSLKEAVSIVTMHKSKGLEFDVVFALGVAMRTPADEDHFEGDCEKIRQFYVAATRARRRLYLPLAYDEEAKSVACGRASPVELFFRHFELGITGGDIHDRTLVYKEIGAPSFARGLEIVRQRSAFTYEEARPAPCHFQPPQQEHVPLTKRGSPQVVRLPFSCDSFSSLWHEAHASSSCTSEIPRGAHVGLLLHEILSTLPSFSFDKQALTKRLQASVLEPYSEQVCTLFEKLFSHPFTSPYGTFSLSLLDMQKSFRECEFFYSESSSQAIRGVIDLCFEYEGNYYLIDWKSQSSESYSPGALECQMKERGYRRQGELYLEAMGRYLAKNGIPQDRLKGIFFVFLRGVQDGDGLYFIDRKECRECT